jgi:hypothetical protein
MQTYSQTASRMCAGKALPYAKLTEENVFTPFVRSCQVCAFCRALFRIVSAVRHLLACLEPRRI